MNWDIRNYIRNRQRCLLYYTHTKPHWTTVSKGIESIVLIAFDIYRSLRSIQNCSDSSTEPPLQFHLYSSTCTVLPVQFHLYSTTCIVPSAQFYPHNLICTDPQTVPLVHSPISTVPPGTVPPVQFHLYSSTGTVPKLGELYLELNYDHARAIYDDPWVTITQLHTHWSTLGS